MKNFGKFIVVKDKNLTSYPDNIGKLKNIVRKLVEVDDFKLFLYNFEIEWYRADPITRTLVKNGNRIHSIFRGKSKSWIRETYLLFPDEKTAITHLTAQKFGL